MADGRLGFRFLELREIKRGQQLMRVRRVFQRGHCLTETGLQLLLRWDEVVPAAPKAIESSQPPTGISCYSRCANGAAVYRRDPCCSLASGSSGRAARKVGHSPVGK